MASDYSFANLIHCVARLWEKAEHTARYYEDHRVHSAKERRTK